MATWGVKKRLVNPARKVKKNRAKLSPAQIKFFGSPQQKAALKRKRRNAALLSKVKTKKRVSAPVKRVKRRKNIPGAIITAGLANPAAKKERRTMSKSKTKKRRSTARPNQSHRSPRRAPRRKNGLIPYNFTGQRRHKKTKRRANPSLRSSGGLLKNGLFMLAGLVGSRLLPQAFLGSKNTGVMGYGSNLAIALGGGFAVKSVLRDSQAGNMFILGGIGGIILRAIQDFTPFGQAINSSLQGVGDVGIYGATTFFVPLAEAPGSDRGQMDLPSAVQRPAMSVSPAQPAGVGGRFSRGRFN